MVKIDLKSPLFHLVTTLTFVFLFGVFLLPGAVATQMADCDDNCDENCDDHGESVCGCIGCTLVTMAFKIPCPEHDPLQTVLGYSIINRSIAVEREFFDRLDKPPKTLLY